MNSGQAHIEKIRVGDRDLEIEDFYKMMYGMFLAQEKPHLALKKVKRFRVHQTTLVSHESDIMSFFNRGFTNFVTADCAIRSFADQDAAFSYIYICFKREMNRCMREATAQERDPGRWTMLDWDRFATGVQGCQNVSQVLVRILRGIRADKDYSRWERNMICQHILALAQASRLIEKKPCRVMQRAYDDVRKALRHEAEELFKEILKSRVNEMCIEQKFAVGA